MSSTVFNTFYNLPSFVLFLLFVKHSLLRFLVSLPLQSPLLPPAPPSHPPPGAVIVSTSNRAPSELGASGFSEEQEESSTTPLSAMAQLLVDSNDVLEMPSQTDYRTRQSRGKPCYFYPNDDHASRMQVEGWNLIGMGCQAGI